MSKYEKYFIQSKRLTSSKPLALIDGDRLEEFFQALLTDLEIENELKLFICLAASGGLRVNEAIVLTKEDFHEQDGILYFNSKVLKKRKEETRYARVHPLVQDYVLTQIQNRVGKLIKKNPSTLYRALRKHFPEGICNHSLRHSLVSYLLFTKNLTSLKVAKLMSIGNKTVEHYAHLDQRKALREVF